MSYTLLEPYGGVGSTTLEPRGPTRGTAHGGMHGGLRSSVLPIFHLLDPFADLPFAQPPPAGSDVQSFLAGMPTLLGASLNMGARADANATNDEALDPQNS
jgi:hypothetical protein